MTAADTYSDFLASVERLYGSTGNGLYFTAADLGGEPVLETEYRVDEFGYVMGWYRRPCGSRLAPLMEPQGRVLRSPALLDQMMFPGL